MRQALSVPALSDRDTYDEWYAKGQRSRVEIAREQVREILKSHRPAPLPESVREQMKEVVAAYSRQ